MINTISHRYAIIARCFSINRMDSYSLWHPPIFMHTIFGSYNCYSGTIESLPWYMAIMTPHMYNVHCSCPCLGHSLAACSLTAAKLLGNIWVNQLLERGVKAGGFFFMPKGADTLLMQKKHHRSILQSCLCSLSNYSVSIALMIS
jgi:hypothetical protein